MKQESKGNNSEGNSMLDMYNLKDRISTGSNWKDALIGSAMGLGEAMNPQGQYYVNSNWAGNGLARSHIGYLPNTNKRDYTSAGMALTRAFRKNKNNEENSTDRQMGTIAPYINSYVQQGLYPTDMFNNYNNADYSKLYDDGSSAIGSGITNLINGGANNGSISDYLSTMFDSGVPMAIFG